MNANNYKTSINERVYNKYEIMLLILVILSILFEITSNLQDTSEKYTFLTVDFIL